MSPKAPAAPRPDPELLLRQFRGTVASLRAAAETLELAAGAGESEPSARLRAALVEDAERLSQLVDQLATLFPTPPRGRRGQRTLAEVIAEVTREARRELELEIQLEGPVIEARLSGAAALTGALLGALARLRRDFAVSRLAARTRWHEELAVIDLAWPADEPQLWRLREAHGTLLSGGLGGQPALRQVVQEAGGEVWLNIDRRAATASLRLLLPRG
ncbi:MAG TPA: hypothetical protein VF017_11560 [Thermoanaerobaculia bacterium]|nr:hypothetical protein [Thermoanaerobaculia bacterium]